MILMSNLEYLKQTDQDSQEAAGEGLGDLALEHVTMWICCFGTEAVHCALPGRHRERLRCGSATKKPSASHQFRRFRRHVQSCSTYFNIKKWCTSPEDVQFFCGSDCEVWPCLWVHVANVFPKKFHARQFYCNRCCGASIRVYHRMHTICECRFFHGQNFLNLKLAADCTSGGTAAVAPEASTRTAWSNTVQHGPWSNKTSAIISCCWGCCFADQPRGTGNHWNRMAYRHLTISHDISRRVWNEGNRWLSNANRIE